MLLQIKVFLNLTLGRWVTMFFLLLRYLKFTIRSFTVNFTYIQSVQSVIFCGSHLFLSRVSNCVILTQILT